MRGSWRCCRICPYDSLPVGLRHTRRLACRNDHIYRVLIGWGRMSYSRSLPPSAQEVVVQVRRYRRYHKKDPHSRFKTFKSWKIYIKYWPNREHPQDKERSNPLRPQPVKHHYHLRNGCRILNSNSSMIYTGTSYIRLTKC